MDHKLKLFLIVFLLVAALIGVNAQELPKVIPPSPEATSLFKYLDYPVDYSTGVPRGNTPLINSPTFHQ